MDKAGVQAAFVAAGLSRLIKDIDLVSKPSIRLSPTPVDESSLKIGTSKLGGTPDLPPEASWPEWKGLPQSFIAQIHLDDVRPYDSAKLLPQSGMLWFFYDAQQQTFGRVPSALRARSPYLSNLSLRFPTLIGQMQSKSNMRHCSQRFPTQPTVPLRITDCWVFLILFRMICAWNASLPLMV